MQLRTISGKMINIANPQPDDFTIEDIAHGLSHMPRWAGHTNHFYSVAQHSILCVTYLGVRNYRKHGIAALLHDASEAYLMDIPKPLKNMLPEYVAIENKFMTAIAQKFGFEYPLNPLVKCADEFVLNIESDWITNNLENYARGTIESMSEVFRIHSPENVKDSFLSMYERLCYGK